MVFAGLLPDRPARRAGQHRHAARVRDRLRRRVVLRVHRPRPSRGRSGRRSCPLVPLLGILACFCLMAGLPADTWARLIVWLVTRAADLLPVWASSIRRCRARAGAGAQGREGAKAQGARGSASERRWITPAPLALHTTSSVSSLAPSRLRAFAPSARAFAPTIPSCPSPSLPTAGRRAPVRRRVPAGTAGLPHHPRQSRRRRPRQRGGAGPPAAAPRASTSWSPIPTPTPAAVRVPVRGPARRGRTAEAVKELRRADLIVVLDISDLGRLGMLGETVRTRGACRSPASTTT